MKELIIRTLLVEDNPGDARLIGEYLKEDGPESFNVIQIDNLQQALSEITQNQWDIILMDLGLPDSQGLDTFTKIHTHAPELPIVVLSGLNDQTTAISAVQNGAQDFLTKDEITPDGLRRTLRYALERHQSEKVLHQKNQYLLALQETTLELVSQLNLPDLLESIVRRSAQLMGTTSGYLDLMNPELNQLIPKIGFGALAESLAFQVEPGQGLAGMVWQSGKAIIVNDYDHWPHRIKNFSYGTLASIIGVPIILNERILGVLGLAYDYASNQKFDDQAVEFLSQFTRLTAIAIENARVYELSQRELSIRKQAEQAFKEQQYLLGLLMDTIPDTIYFKDRHSNFIRINRAQADRLGLESPDQAIGKSDFDIFTPEFAQSAFSLEEKILHTGDAVVNFEEMLTYADRAPEWVLATKMPLRNQDGEIFGTFGISRDITERKNAELQLEHQTEELKKLNRELSRLYSTSSSLFSTQSSNLFELGQAIVETIIQEFGTSNCSLHILKKGSTELIGLAFAERYPNQYQAVKLKIDGPGLIPSAIRSKRIVNVPDVTTQPEYIKGWEGAKSELVVPLLVNDRVIGVINVESDQAANFSADDERLLATFANQAAIAIENANLLAETSTQVQRLSSLRKIDETINASLDLNMTTTIILEQVLKQLNIDSADILLFNPVAKSLRYINGKGLNTPALQHTDLRLGQGLAGRAALERQIIHVSGLNSSTDFFTQSPYIKDENFVEYFGVPLISKGTVKGVLEIFHRSALTVDDSWLDFLNTLAGQAAIAIDNIGMFTDLQHSNNLLSLAYDATIEGWSRTLDLRDKETEGHTLRVTDITLRLARASGIEEEELIHIRRGTLLHDIGKMGIPDGILLKPGPLTAEEWPVMRQHPQFAFELLSPIDFLKPALDIPYCHHEKWDGSGYPRGLKGEQIPLSARLFAVVDVWDALTSDRPYREAWPESQAVEFIREQAGKHFDPQAVELFMNRYLSEESPLEKPTILIVDDEEDVTRSLARSLREQFTVLTAHSGEDALKIIERADPAVVLTDQRMPGISGVELLGQIQALKPKTVGILISGYSDVVALTAALNLSNVRGFIPKPWDLDSLRGKLDQAVTQYRELANGSRMKL